MLRNEVENKNIVFRLQLTDKQKINGYYLLF